MSDNRVTVMLSADLAERVRVERARLGIPQAEVARRVAARPDTASCSPQAVSQAENPAYGLKLDGLRIKILETLTGRKVEGPAYFFADERA